MCDEIHSCFDDEEALRKLNDFVKAHPELLELDAGQFPKSVEFLKSGTSRIIDHRKIPPESHERARAKATEILRKLDDSRAE